MRKNLSKDVRTLKKDFKIASALERNANEISHLHDKILMQEEEVVLNTSCFITLE